MRIGEGNPYLINLIFGKEGINEFNSCSQESYIWEILFIRCFGSPPHTSSLYINAYKIVMMEIVCQTDSIFSLSASQFEYNRIFIFEKFLIPFTLYWVIITLSLIHISEPTRLGMISY